MSAPNLPAPLCERLPPGPGSDPDQVAYSQFQRLCAAMTHGVAAGGYEQLTVRGLCSLAGVSAKTLYRHFPEGMHECFLGAQERAALAAGDRIAAAQAGAQTALERLRTGIRGFCEMVAEHPQPAYLLLVEAQCVSAQTRAKAMRVEEIAARALADRLGLESDPPPALPVGIVAGLLHAARELLLQERAVEMPVLAGRLTGWALAACELALRHPSSLAPQVPRSARRREPERLRAMRLDDARSRLIAAAIELLAEGDALRLSIDALAEHALLPRRRVELFYGGCRPCLLAAVETCMAELLDRAARHPEAGGAPPGRLSVIVRELQDDRDLALAVFTGLPALGTEGVRMRRGLASAFAHAVQGASDAEDGDGVSRLGAAAIWGVIEHRLAAGRALPAPQELACLLAPIAAPPVSREAALAAGA